MVYYLSLVLFCGLQREFSLIGSLLNLKDTTFIKSQKKGGEIFL